MIDAPHAAAKAAARSMTVFKHFYESRGSCVATQGSEFHNYRGLHKIAFPPTHPQCKELFLQVCSFISFYFIDLYFFSFVLFYYISFLVLRNFLLHFFNIVNNLSLYVHQYSLCRDFVSPLCNIGIMLISH